MYDIGTKVQILCILDMISGMISGFLDPYIGSDIMYDIRYDIGYDILVDVVNISYPISDKISYPISLHYRYLCTVGAPESRPSYPPHESDDGPNDIKMDADDMLDYLDKDPDVPPTSTAKLGPCVHFLAELPDWSDLSQSD
jgi:hypothetical protein